MKNIINLLPDPLQTIKRIVFFASTILFVLHGCQKDLELNNVPTITDGVEVGATYAVITGTVECPIATTKLEVQVYPAAAAYNDTTFAVEFTTDNAFELTLTDLLPTTDYSYRYVIYSSADSTELKSRRFTTLAKSAPKVVTTGIDSITMTTALCSGNVSSDGGEAITARGICYSTAETPTIDGLHTTAGAGPGEFSSTLTGLTAATTYYVRAYATNAIGTAYGEQMTFTTHDGKPTVSTSNTVNNITQTTAVCGGTVHNDYGYEVTARGVCWSTIPNPTIADSYTTDGTGTGNFTSNLTNLTDSTTYYLRAYATNQNGTAYGEERVFTTLGDYINGHKYVDLGLPSGTKWATCNVGASQEWEFGDYYAWGETETKEEYYIGNCRTYHMELTNISGNPTFDAATVHWGSTWRIPTKEEMEELIINCSRTWITSYNGVNGYRMTGPNGNSIFLPAAGRQYEDRYIGETNGYYWSATSWDGKFRGDHINFYPDNEFPIYSSYRNYGQPIRPVSN